MANIARTDLNLFVVFDAIYTEGNVSRAAEKLNLSQPAISQALARLRELFDDPLFVRQGHAMVPTPVARNSVEPVRSSLRTLEMTLNKAHHFDPSRTRRRMVIGLPSSEESLMIPPLVERVIRHAPLIDVVTTLGNRYQLEFQLAAGMFDVAVDLLLQHSKDLIHRKVNSEPLVAVVRRGHPCAETGFDMDTYFAQEHVLVTSRYQQPGLIEPELNRIGRERRVRLCCQQYLAAFPIVASSDLVLTMPRYTARCLNANFDNIILPLPMEIAPLTLYLYWHSSVDDDPANQWLRAQFIEVFDELGRRAAS